MMYVGHMKGSFKDRNTGKEINFAKLYVTYKQDGVVGVKSEEIKCDYRLVPDLERLHTGDEIDVYYDRYQRATRVIPIPGGEKK